MSFDYASLVTDRTEMNVKRLLELKAKNYDSMTDAEKAEWNANMKGAYNATDLNRVSACMEDLVSRLDVMGYAVPGYTRVSIPRTDSLDPYTWYMTDTPTAAQMEQYRQNVAAVRAVLVLPSGTESPPDSMLTLDTAGANAIEQILAAIDIILDHIPAAYRHSGVSVCGGKGVIA